MSYDHFDRRLRTVERRTRPPGCVGAILWLLIASCGPVVMLQYIDHGKPRLRSDNEKGQQYLCWTTDVAWPLEEQFTDRESCVRVDHSRWIKDSR